MNCMILSSLLCLAAGVAFAAEEQPMRLDISSQPSEATVVIDGNARGTTPLTLMDVKPGRHLVAVSAANYATKYEFVKLAPGSFLQKNYELRPEKGILLIKTEPAGCDVTFNGLSLGSTPLLVTSINAGGPYQVTISQNGYQSKTVDFSLEGRQPRVISETLSSDSGMLVVQTSPAGAMVMVNGVERGASPVTVQRVPKGTAIVSIRMEGYDAESREVKIAAGETETLNVQLKGRPARMNVVTIPEKARVYLDGEFQGVSPVDIVTQAGSHKLKATHPGYADAEEDVTLSVGDKVTRELQLASTMARIDVRTSPVGAEVYVDGQKIGKTRNTVNGANVSETLEIGNLVEGEHLVEVKMKGCESARKRVTLTASKTLELKVTLRRMFIPDIEIHTYSGSVRRGVLLEQGLDGSYRIETSPGVELSVSASDVKEAKVLEK